MLLLLTLLASSCNAFAPHSIAGFVPGDAIARPSRRSSSPPSLSSLGMVASDGRTTLDADTSWRLRFVLNGVPTASGGKVDGLFVTEAKFLEEEGYEPPQGSVVQVLSPEDDASADDESVADAGADAGPKRGRLDISSGRWKLSEDPDERKDGLWVWGLFQEPLYPYLLLQLETKEIPLPGGDGTDSIKPLQLYAQITHTRDKEKGVILDATTLKVREVETIKADPFGGATVDIYEEIQVGQLSIQPVMSAVQA